MTTKEKIKLILLEILGINALFRFMNRNKALILMYHGICDDGFDLLKGYDERHITVSLFRKQLTYLKQSGYSFVTMSELEERLKNKTPVRKLVVLTFDDGFRNIADNAYPIMKELGAKGCFYLISDLIGADKLLWTDYVETVVRNSAKGEFLFSFEGRPITYILDTKASYEKAMLDIKRKLKKVPNDDRKRYLQQFDNIKIDTIPKEFFLCDWERIRSLDRRFLEVGSHTATHPNCTSFTSDEEFEREIKGSKAEIEKQVGYEVKHFCYPIGAYNDGVIERLKRYGYWTAVTTTPGFNDENTDVYKLRRIAPREDFLHFKSVASGSYFSFTRMQ